MYFATYPRCTVSRDSGRMNEARQHRWQAALGGLRADALDCLQTTLALVADHAHGSGAHAVLGCRWRLQVDEHDGLIGVRRSLDDRLEDAADLLGLEVVERWSELGGADVRSLLASRSALYLVGEAHDMPWLPYAGRRFMPHSFLLEADGAAYTVVDAYHNNTQWGAARPGAWTLTGDSLDRVLARGAIAMTLRAGRSSPAVDPLMVLTENGSRARSAEREIQRYVEAVQAQLDRAAAAEQLALDIWLLGRERLLHAIWLASLGRYAVEAAEADRLAEAWQRLATASYVAARRAQRGVAMARSIVDDLGDQLRADAAFAAGLRPHASVATFPVTGQ